MTRRICQGLLALAGLYALAIVTFVFLGYRAPRPDVWTMVKGFHSAIGGAFRSKALPAADAADTPPPRVPSPEPPPAATLAPEPAPERPPPDPRRVALDEVRLTLIPQARRELAAIGGGEGKLDRLADARATLVRARDLVGPLLDHDRTDAEARELYDRVQVLLASVDKR